MCWRGRTESSDDSGQRAWRNEQRAEKAPEKFMRTVIIGIMLSALLLALCLPAHAQQPKKVPRIGYLTTRSGAGAGKKAFLQGLQSLGYIEGQTIAIEWRFAQEKFDRLPELASELVRLKVDVIIASGGSLTVEAVQDAHTTIPLG